MLSRKAGTLCDSSRNVFYLTLLLTRLSKVEITYWRTWRPLKTIRASFTLNPLCSNRTRPASRPCCTTLSTSSLRALLTPAPYLERQKNIKDTFNNRQRLKRTSVSVCFSAAVGAGAFGVSCKCTWNKVLLVFRTELTSCTLMCKWISK